MYETRNHLLVCTENLEPKLHSHSAAHIMISLNDKIDVFIKNETIQCRGIVIPSGVTHTANIYVNKVLIFLFDNTTSVAKQIVKTNVLSDVVVDKIVEAYYFFENNEKSSVRYNKFMNYVYEGININVVDKERIDDRIKAALIFIRENLQESIACRDVADHIFLSEGRFSHLFKEQVGMTFSAYFIYQRVINVFRGIR